MLSPLVLKGDCIFSSIVGISLVSAAATELFILIYLFVFTSLVFETGFHTVLQTCLELTAILLGSASQVKGLLIRSATHGLTKYTIKNRGLFGLGL